MRFVARPDRWIPEQESHDDAVERALDDLYHRSPFRGISAWLTILLPAAYGRAQQAETLFVALQQYYALVVDQPSPFDNLSREYRCLYGRISGIAKYIGKNVAKLEKRVDLRKTADSFVTGLRVVVILVWEVTWMVTVLRSLVAGVGEVEDSAARDTPQRGLRTLSRDASRLSEGCSALSFRLDDCLARLESEIQTSFLARIFPKPASRDKAEKTTV